MKKKHLKLIAVMLGLTFGLCSQMRADYVTSITSGGYYRIVSAYSGFNTADKYVMYIDDSGNLGWRAYDSNKEAEQIFLITVEPDKTIKIDSNTNPARDVKCIGNNYFIHMGSNWYGAAGTSLNAWPINFVQSSANTSQWVIYPAQAGPNYDACCQGLQPDNAANTSGTITKSLWNTTVNYANEINCWYLEPVESSVYQPILDANDALKNALQAYEEDYNTLVSSDQVGYHVKANVDAFKAKYEECNTAYLAGTLTDAEKQSKADELNAAHATAIGTYNELAEGYYVIKSAASAFGSNEYAMYIDDNGGVSWGAYNDSALGQFVFQLTDLNTTARPDGVTYEVFSFYSPYQKKYIGQASAQMASEPAKTQDDSWGVVSQRKKDLPQFAIQPMWNTTGTASYCLIVDNTSNTSGTVRTSGWFSQNGNSAQSWTFTAIDEATALAAVANMDALKAALDNYADAYTNLASTNNPGFYVKANVDAFKAKYAEANTAYNNGSNTLTNTQKSEYASQLNTAYATAISATNPIVDGAYYNIVSAYPSGTKRTLCIEQDGSFVWKDYDEANKNQFAFKFTDQNAHWGNDSGTTSYAYAMQNVLSGKYIGSGSGAGMGIDGVSTDSPYNVCVTATNTPGQFIIQPRRNDNSGFTQGLTVHDGGLVRHTKWCGAILDGNANGNWIFEEIEPIAIPEDGAAAIYADGEVTAADIVAALTGLQYTAIDLSGITLASGVSAADIAALQTGNTLVYLPSSATFTGTNMVKDGVCTNLLLTDGQPFSAPTPFTATSATYDRAMTNEWGTICLPYAVSSDANTEYYNITAIESNSLVVSKVDNLAAGTPALVHKVSGSAITAAAANAPVSATIAAPSGTVQMIGKYERTKIEDPNAYYIKDNKFWQCNNNFYCGAFRAYFTTSSAPSSAFDILIADDDPTAISSMLNAQCSMSDAVAIYSVDGKKLATLQKGVNIVKLANGKTQKVVVK